MSSRDMFELADYTTDDWGAAANYNRPERPGNDQVFVHHPGFNIRESADNGNVNGEKAQLRSIEENAMGDNWWGIPYDIMVGQSGKIYMGRGLARSGATSGDVDDDGTHNNDEGEAICVLVSPGRKMTEAARDSLKRLLDAHGGDVYGHKEAKGTATSCPGDDRMEFIVAYRNGTLDEDESEGGVSADGKTYTVVEGDTLSRIAMVTNVSMKNLIAWNDIDDPDLIHPGDIFVLYDRTEETPDPTPDQNWTEKIMADLGYWKRGERGPRVKRIQALINMSRLSSLSEDGIFGPKTEQAVIEYQNHFRLAADGIVGPKTWEHLLLANY